MDITMNIRQRLNILFLLLVACRACWFYFRFGARRCEHPRLECRVHTSHVSFTVFAVLRMITLVVAYVNESR